MNNFCINNLSSYVRYEKTKRKRSIHEEYVSEYPWVEVENDRMVCKVCREFPEFSDSTSTLVKGVFGHFRKETLRYHNKSEKHNVCMNRK